MEIAFFPREHKCGAHGSAREVRRIAVSFLLIISAGLAACAKAQPPQSYAEELYQNRTQYVGNASAVGALLDTIRFPGGLSGKREGFELQTKKKPYGLFVRFKAEGDELSALEKEEYTAQQYKNALLLFALIDNLDNVEFSVSDGSRAVVMQLSRGWADYMTGGDVKACAASPETLHTLLDAQIDSSSFENGAYIVSKLEYGKETQILSCPIGAKASAVCRDAVQSHMMKSAAWKGKDPSTLSSCYRVRCININISAPFEDHYFYVLEDASAVDSPVAVGQSGEDGYYSIISGGEYSALAALFF